MTNTMNPLPLTQTVAPADAGELAAVVREAFESTTPVYPIGGGTSLDEGLPATRPGIGLSLESLHRVVDYPARDMTITVEPGITMARLAETLAAEGQQLPVDPPRADRATLGGVVATATSGPRRAGYGTIRDYVIGVSAVDGRGSAFRGGGRVVKNVAGYDFCKLLTGSRGTLAVITQLTLKVVPIAERSTLVACDVPTLARAEELLAALVTGQTTPVAVELLAGPHWREDPALGDLADGNAARLVVGLEGTAAEVRWMVDRLQQEWREMGVAEIRVVEDGHAVDLWGRLSEFPAAGPSPFVVKAGLVPSAVTQYVGLCRRLDPDCSIAVHAAGGVVFARFSDSAAGEISGEFVRRLQPLAVNCGGEAVVLASAAAGELTRQMVWGGRGDAAAVVAAVKRKFDPRGILNPGRFNFVAHEP